MKKLKKPARGRAFNEGCMVRSKRESDDGATGVVVGMSKKKNGWVYTVFFEGWYKVATRGEEELEEI